MVKYKGKLKERNIYLNQLISFKDTEPVKVITGIRRCGKSSLLTLMREYLLNSGINKEQIIAINFESLVFQEMSYKDLYEYVKERIHTNKRYYLFFDELQRIHGWDNASNSFRVDFDCDIYITGSNSVYAKTEEETQPDNVYQMHGNQISVKTLDLNLPIENIKKQMNAIVESHFILDSNTKFISV